LLDLKGQKLTIKPEALIIPEINKIWESDKTPDKSKAVLYLKYIYITTDPRSVYLKSYGKREIDKIARRELGIRQSWKVTKDVEAAQKKYKELKYTQSLRALDATTNVLEGILKALDNYETNPEEPMTADRLKEFREMINLAKDIGPVIDNLERLRKKIEESLGDDLKGTGNKTISAREVPK